MLYYKVFGYSLPTVWYMRNYNFTIHQIDTHNNIPKSRCLSRCLVFCFIRIVANPSVFFRCCFRITRRFMLWRKNELNSILCSFQTLKHILRVSWSPRTMHRSCSISFNTVKVKLYLSRNQDLLLGATFTFRKLLYEDYF